MREEKRKAYDDRQAEAARAAADRARSGDQRSQAAANPSRRPVVKLGSPTPTTITAAERQKNAADFASHQKAAEDHQKQIDRRLVEKAADRKRRADVKAAKDAKAAAAAAKAVDAGR